MLDGRYDHGYGREWTEVLVYRREGYTTSVADFHRHEYYEINLILSGNVHILLPEQSLETNRSHIVLAAPGVPHFISCKPDTLYSRLYLCFSAAFVEGCIPQWEQLRQVFGKNGRIVAVSRSQRELCESVIRRIGEETDRLRQRLLSLYLLSYICQFAQSGGADPMPAPPYVIEALSYIDRHYREKLLADELAASLHIGRTTLMTAFKKYTGTPMNTYLIRFRLKKAVKLLQEGRSVQETAEQCGFGDSSGLIRSFKKEFGTTPKRYLGEQTDPLHFYKL